MNRLKKLAAAMLMAGTLGIPLAAYAAEKKLIPPVPAGFLINPYRYATTSLPTVTVETSFTKTASLTASFSFNYASSHAIGELCVMTVLGRSSSAITWDATATDAAGNTYTKRVQGTQSNGLTVTAIYDCVLTAAVTSATAITVSGNAVTYVTAQGAVLLTLTGVTGYDSSTTSQQTATSNTTSLTTGGPFTGVGVHAVSTGGNTTFTSCSAGWTHEADIGSTTSKQFVCAAASNAWSDPVADTQNLGASVTTAGVLAYYA